MIDFFVFRNASKKFPDFPDEDDGGSNAIFANKTLGEIQAELDAVKIEQLIVNELHLCDYFVENGK